MNNRIWGLTIFILVLLLGLGLFLIWQLGQTLAPTPEPVAVKWAGLTSPTSLAEAETKASLKAQDWQADAELIKVEASWRPGPDLVTVTTPLVGWVFYYYSPNQGAIVTVSVRDTKLFLGPAIDIPGVPRSLTPFPPEHGIETAWLNFRAGGGGKFLQEHNEALVHYQLKPTTNGPVWEIAAIIEKEVFRLAVDASSGLIVTPSP